MNRMPVVAVVISALALVIALVALLSVPKGADDVRAGLTTLGERIESLRSDVAEVTSRSDEVKRRTQDLKVECTRLSEQAARLDRAIGQLAEKREAPPSKPVELDEGKVRGIVGEVVREEMRAALARTRGAGGEGPPDMSAAGFRERLGLDEQTAEKVATIYRERSEAVRDIWRSNRGGDRDGNVRLMQELQKKTDAQIAEILTPEQLEKFKEMENQARRGRPRDRRRGQGGQGGQQAGENPF